MIHRHQKTEDDLLYRIAVQEDENSDAAMVETTGLKRLLNLRHLNKLVKDAFDKLCRVYVKVMRLPSVRLGAPSASHC